MTPKRRCCEAKTKAGKPCKANPIKGTNLCLAHSDAETRKSLQFVGGQPGSGRPPKPRLIDTLREKVEAEISEWLKPFYEGKIATKHVVVGNGPSARVEEIPDIPTRMAASREIFDRIEGKPKQATEVTGADGGPVSFADLAATAGGND